MTRRRLPIVVVLLAALLASGVLRQVAANMRGEADPRAGGVPLSRMNSYALALLLGGLRGPLVMILWPSSEGQKSEKNVEDLDTKIEWIRLLQAEFDTVHIFQIWNKAYNISVLMANLPNKYATILDALDYAYAVNAERPNNINILYAIGSIYFDKLGSSAEKRYYRQRVRDETQARQPLVRVTLPEARGGEFVEAALAAGLTERRLQITPDKRNARLSVTLTKSQADIVRPLFGGEGITWADKPRVERNRKDSGWRRTELDPLLTLEGNILPDLLQPRGTPTTQPGMADGSALQYLKRYQPFPYGVSTMALAYNYYRQAQSLLRFNNQNHAQLSDLVVDSRPALALRDWSEEEWERGRIAEIEALGMPVPLEKDDQDWRINLELVSARAPLDSKIVNRTAADEALFSYARTAQLAEDAIVEYTAHLERFRTNFDTYRSHMEALAAQRSLVLGDYDFLNLLASPPQERAALARSAADHYVQAVRDYQILLLKYYVTTEQIDSAFPKGMDRSAIDDFARADPEQADQIIEKIRQDVQKQGQQAQHLDEFKEYYRYIRRAQFRVGTLAPLLENRAGAE
jgi:hypothetical protein